MKTVKEQGNVAKKEVIDEDDYIDLDLDDELEYEDPVDYLEVKYRFIQDDIQLIIRVNKKTGMQSLILRLINLKTQKSILERKQKCIHVAIVDQAYEQGTGKLKKDLSNNLQSNLLSNLQDNLPNNLPSNLQTKDFDHEILMIKSTEQLKKLNLSIEDRLFALKSWAECIVDSDIGALLFQGEIDRYTRLKYPISHFIMNFLSLINLDYFLKYIDYIEKVCVFEGQKHEPSIRANVCFLLNVLEQSDYLKNTEDPVKLNAVKKIMSRLSEIDKDTFLTSKFITNFK